MEKICKQVLIKNRGRTVILEGKAKLTCSERGREGKEREKEREREKIDKKKGRWNVEMRLIMQMKRRTIVSFVRGRFRARFTAR